MISLMFSAFLNMMIERYVQSPYTFLYRSLMSEMRYISDSADGCSIDNSADRVQCSIADRMLVLLIDIPGFEADILRDGLDLPIDPRAEKQFVRTIFTTSL